MPHVCCLSAAPAKPWANDESAHDLPGHSAVLDVASLSGEGRKIRLTAVLDDKPLGQEYKARLASRSKGRNQGQLLSRGLARLLVGKQRIGFQWRRREDTVWTGEFLCAHHW